MLIAGEASSDALAAELVRELRARPEVLLSPTPPGFFGAGGAHMREAGVEVITALARHAVFGLVEVFKHYHFFRSAFDTLLKEAVRRQPDLIVLIDSAGFNRRFAAAIRAHVRAHGPPFNNWSPRIVYFVSPQVWASRPGRAVQLARDVDLLLSIFPFEKAWYAQHTPHLHVEFVGHPMLDRYAGLRPHPQETASGTGTAPAKTAPLLVLLPGSRRQEILRHWPIMTAAAHAIHRECPVRILAVLPSQEAANWVGSIPFALPPASALQVGGLAEALQQATVAVACSGTVTMECAFFRVPTVVLYKLSWLTYWIARQIVTVRHVAMPNLLADARVFPEFIQGAATPERIATAALAFLSDGALRNEVACRLDVALASLGKPGAARRAAAAILAGPGSCLPT